MKIDWNTLVTVALAILIAAVLKELVVDKALAKAGAYDDDDDEYEDFD